MPCLPHKAPWTKARHQSQHTVVSATPATQNVMWVRQSRVKDQCLTECDGTCCVCVCEGVCVKELFVTKFCATKLCVCVKNGV